MSNCVELWLRGVGMRMRMFGRLIMTLNGLLEFVILILWFWSIVRVWIISIITTILPVNMGLLGDWELWLWVMGWILINSILSVLIWVIRLISKILYRISSIVLHRVWLRDSWWIRRDIRDWSLKLELCLKLWRKKHWPFCILSILLIRDCFWILHPISGLLLPKLPRVYLKLFSGRRLN